ncbi:MAG: enoyl-CoA hydratase/isomerase family protein [Agarilytica sp.]
MTAVEQLVGLTFDSGVAYIRLQTPKRHNTLTLPLLEQLLECFQIVAKEKHLTCIVLHAQGKSFSTGGDITAFIANEDNLENYSHSLVGLLNQTILAMLKISSPIVTRVQGPVTGGSIGLVLASDLVVMAKSAFIAPYYVDVGFAPDGGWTALLPNIISRRKALEIQLLNKHITAQEAQELQIVHAVCAEQDLDTQINTWVDTLKTKVPQSLTITKTLIQDASYIKTIEDALEQERQAFIHCISQPEALAGMKQFTSKLKTKISA